MEDSKYEQKQYYDHAWNIFQHDLVNFFNVATSYCTSTPIVTKFGIGYADGKHNAQEIFRSGGQRDASCPVSFWSNISYCLGYHAGYDATWFELSSGSSR